MLLLLWLLQLLLVLLLLLLICCWELLIHEHGVKLQLRYWHHLVNPVGKRHKQGTTPNCQSCATAVPSQYVANMYVSNDLGIQELHTSTWQGMGVSVTQTLAVKLLQSEKPSPPERHQALVSLFAHQGVEVTLEVHKVTRHLQQSRAMCALGVDHSPCTPAVQLTHASCCMQTPLEIEHSPCKPAENSMIDSCILLHAAQQRPAAELCAITIATRAMKGITAFRT